jgi:hypothetical protein
VETPCIEFSAKTNATRDNPGDSAKEAESPVLNWGRITAVQFFFIQRSANAPLILKRPKQTPIHRYVENRGADLYQSLSWLRALSAFYG